MDGWSSAEPEGWIRWLTPQEKLGVMIEALNELDVLETCLLRATTAQETINEKLRQIEEQPVK